MRLQWFFIIGMLVLTGCAIPTQTKIVVISPPPVLMNCPVVPVAPKAETLTNQEVVNYIADLRGKLAVCGVNMQGIEKYVAQAEKIYRMEGK